MATTACFIIVSRNDIPIYEAEVGSATKVWTSFLLLSFLFIYALLVWLETQILRNEMYGLILLALIIISNVPWYRNYVLFLLCFVISLIFPMLLFLFFVKSLSMFVYQISKHRIKGIRIIGLHKREHPKVLLVLPLLQS